MEIFWQDFRYAARELARSPGFTTIAVLILALGIGVNTACFSILDVTFFRPLPVRDTESLVRIVQKFPKVGSMNSLPRAYYDTLHEHSRMLSAVFGEAIVDTPVSGMGRAENVRVYLPTPEYFEVLGVRALHGRTLTSSDETNQAGVTFAVLSYRFWKRSFEGNVEAHQPELLRASKPDSADWAIQSARLVLQYAQLQAREKSRDESEMDNFRALDPMGGYLRDSFGSSLINFGFSFQRRIFQGYGAG
jgi:hypothetical protein